MKAQMQRFTKKIVDMMKAERLYESQGGPIILSQVGKLVPIWKVETVVNFLSSRYGTLAICS